MAVYELRTRLITVWLLSFVLVRSEGNTSSKRELNTQGKETTSPGSFVILERRRKGPGRTRLGNAVVGKAFSYQKSWENIYPWLRFLLLQ